MGIRGHKPHSGEPAGDQPSQESGPGRPVLGGDHVDAEDLAVAVGVDGGGDYHGDVHYPPAVPAAHGQGVKPQVPAGPAVQRPVAERLNPLVQAPRHLRYTGLRDPFYPECLDQAVYPARGHAGDVALRDHRHQGPLGAPAGLKQPLWKAWPEPAEG